MKKLHFLMLTLLVLAACNNNSSITPSSSSSSVTSTNSSSSSLSSSTSVSSSSEVPNEEQYQIFLLAQQSGYTGTYQEWLDSIKGADGLTPYIGENGNWWIGDEDTGVFAGNQDAIPQTGEFQYAVNSDGKSYVLTRYIGKDRFVIVPERYNGYPVSVIGAGAFASNGDLEKIILSNNIYKIESYAFTDCTSLTQIEYPNDLISIGEYAFNGTRITSFVIPETITSISNNLFSYTPLNSIVIPDTVITIGDNAFRQTQIQNFDFPNELISIGAYAFASSKLASDIIIPETTSFIGQYAFRATNITSITIPKSVSTIGDYAISSSKPLTIYVEVASKPIGWNENWNNSQYPITVIWDYKNQ
jgi:hypothetical protein